MDDFNPTCPRCGAKSSQPATRLDWRCAFCGTINPADVSKPAQFEPDSIPALLFLPPVSLDHPGLPAEYAGLKRPRSSTPLTTQGCGMLAFGIIWTLICSVFLFFGVGFFVTQAVEYQRLTTEGQIARAAITQLDVDDSGDSTSYSLTYQFTARVNGDSMPFTHRESISQSAYAALRVGQTIEVRYAGSDPNVSRLKSEVQPPNPLVGLATVGVGGLFTLIGVVILLAGIKAQGQLMKLRSSGQVTSAILFDRWKDTDSEGSASYYVAYVFQVPSSRGHLQFTRAEQNRMLYDRCKVGDILTVRYLPANPEVSQVVDKS